MKDTIRYEYPDSTPVSMPVRLKRPQSEFDRIKALVRNELSRQAQNEGHETWEEANDFNVGDDYDPTSPWELSADNEEEYGNPFEDPGSADPDPGLSDKPVQPVNKNGLDNESDP